MSMTVTMNEAGFLELPEVVRRHFKLKGAARLELEVREDSITLRPERCEATEGEVRIEKRGNRMVIVGAPPVTSVQIVQAIAEGREEQTERILDSRRQP